MTVEAMQDELMQVYLKLGERFLPIVRNRLANDPYFKMIQNFIKIDIDEAMTEEIKKFVINNRMLADINCSLIAMDITAYLEKCNIKI